MLVHNSFSRNCAFFCPENEQETSSFANEQLFRLPLPRKNESKNQGDSVHISKNFFLLNSVNLLYQCLKERKEALRRSFHFPISRGEEKSRKGISLLSVSHTQRRTRKAKARDLLYVGNHIFLPLLSRSPSGKKVLFPSPGVVTWN